MSQSKLTREQQRQAEQLAFAASGQDLRLGTLDDFPLTAAQLAATSGSEAYVVDDLGGGLTAHVYRIRTQGRDWTLKRARRECLVQNVDGQTSFLNEVQRRCDINALKANPATANRMRALVDTRYASYREGIILSPWIAGEHINNWDERRLHQCFSAISELLQAGLFEWDYCAANLLDDGQLRLFDFGYMYRFDPLSEFNSNGTAAPLFHGIERFETRCYFAYLLQLENTQGMGVALQAFRLEKTIALHTYQQLQHSLQARGAQHIIVHWLQTIISSWQTALSGDLHQLYLSEGWRSHRLDVDDDLRGQTCTPLTLARINWLRAVVYENFAALTKLQAFFGEDAQLTQTQLLAELDKAERNAITWQINNA